MGSNHSNEKLETKTESILEKKLKKYQLEENNESLKKEILSFFQWEAEPKKMKSDICNFLSCCKPIEVLKPHSQKAWRKILISQYKPKIKANKEKFKWAKRLCSILKTKSFSNDQEYQTELPLILLKSFNSSSSTSLKSNPSIYPSCDMSFIETPLASTYFDSIPWCPSGDLDFANPLSSIEIIKNYDHGSLLEDAQEGKKKFIYKAIINMIEKHLKDEHNILHMLMKSFEKGFLEENKTQQRNNIASSSEISKNENTPTPRNIDQLANKEITEDYINNPTESKTLFEMFEEVKGFLEFMRDAILEFYEIETLEQRIEKFFKIQIEFFSADNLMNFITSFFFHTFEVYYFLFKLQAENDHANETLLRSKFQSLKNWKPSDFQIKEALRLDETTVDYIEKNFKSTMVQRDSCLEESELGSKWKERGEFIQKSRPKEEESLIQNMERHNSLKYFFPAKTKIMDVKEHRRRRISSSDCDQPYGKVIKKLENMSQLKSPVHQLKVLGETFKLMGECVEQFYRKFGGMKESITLEAHDLISILMYAISRVRPQRILSHIKFIRFFITDRYIYDIVAYQLTTLEVCIEAIKSTDVKEEKMKFMNLVKASVLNEVGMEEDKRFLRKGSF